MRLIILTILILLVGGLTSALISAAEQPTSRTIDANISNDSEVLVGTVPLRAGQIVRVDIDTNRGI